MKIGIGKFGKSVVFGSVTGLRKAMTSGAIDAPTIYKSLFKYYPQHQFYFIGRTNFSRMAPEDQAAINVHGNVFDPWGAYNEWKLSYPGNEKQAPVEFLDEWRLKSGIKLDVGIFLPGNMLNISVQGYSVNKDETKLADCLFASCNYAGPMNHYINNTKLPYLMLLTDPRCYTDGLNLDLFVVPKLILSQYNEEITVSHMTRYDKRATVKETIPAVYSGIETLYLQQEKEEASPPAPGLGSFFGVAPEPPKEKPVRDIPMILFLNEGNPSRYDDVMKYVLGESNQIKVYGKWDEKILKSDPRFEDIPMSELSHTFDRIKYTFCIPIKKGWATGKFWDMARMGIIPFVHPDYDSQKNIGFPEWLRVESAADLKEKMDFLDANPDKYTHTLQVLKDMITPDKVDGTYISNTIMKAAEKIYDENHKTQD